VKFLQKLPNAAKEFASQLVLASRFVVDDALGRTKYGNTKPAQNMRYVSVSAIRSASWGADAVYSPDGRLSINVFQMNLYAFVAFFRLAFTAFRNKTSFLENGSQPCPQVRVRIGAGGLASFPGISDNGNEISYSIVYGHVDGGFSLLPRSFDHAWHFALQGKFSKCYPGQSKFPNGCPGSSGKSATVNQSNGRGVARQFGQFCLGGIELLLANAWIGNNFFEGCSFRCKTGNHSLSFLVTVYDGLLGHGMDG